MDAHDDRPTAFEEEIEASQRQEQAQISAGAQGLNKSTNSLPPFASQSRVSRIKNAVHQAKDDDLERAQESQIGLAFAQSSPQNQAFLQKSTLSRELPSHHHIDAECEKLKESYTQHRRQRNS